MKRILALLLLTAAPAASHAAGNDGPFIHPVAPRTQITGRVSVLYPRCIGCPPVVRVQDGDAGYVSIGGDLALDLAAFDGRVVTVKGRTGERGALEASGFAPGKSDRFVTGTVELASPDCPPNARCAAKVYLNTADGDRVLVKDGFQFGLTALEGATVTVRGDVRQTRCAPRTRCLGSEPTLTVDEGKNLLVRARIEALAHGMNGQTHRGTLDDGRTLLVAGKRAWSDRNHATVWMSGKVGYERISGAPMFEASSASRAVPVVPAIEPFPWPAGGSGDGANVARGAGTSGAVTGSGEMAAGADGAGMARD